MKKNSPSTLLNDTIEQMEIERSQELILLKAQFHEVRESLKPINLIKSSVKTMTNSDNLKKGIGKTVIGVASGLLIKKVFFRNTHNPIKLAASVMLQTAAVNLVANNSEKIISTGRKLLSSMFSKSKHSKSQV